MSANGTDEVPVLNGRIKELEATNADLVSRLVASDVTGRAASKRMEEMERLLREAEAEAQDYIETARRKSENDKLNI